MIYGKVIVGMILLFFVQSCYESQEGCTEVFAVNFDVSADKNCCCIYPTLSISTKFNLDTASFIPGQNFVLESNDTIVIDNISLGGVINGITGSLQIPDYDTILVDKKEHIIPKLYIASARNKTFPIIDYKEFAEIKASELKIGFPTVLDTFPIDKLPDGYRLKDFPVLYEKGTGMWNDVVLSYAPDNHNKDSILYIPLDNLSVPLASNFTYQNEKGQNVFIFLEFRVDRFLKNFDLHSTLEEQKSLLRNNIKQAIKFIE